MRVSNIRSRGRHLFGVFVGILYAEGEKVSYHCFVLVNPGISV
jgi:hypothetical protein